MEKEWNDNYTKESLETGSENLSLPPEETEKIQGENIIFSPNDQRDEVRKIGGMARNANC